MTMMAQSIKNIPGISYLRNIYIMHAGIHNAIKRNGDNCKIVDDDWNQIGEMPDAQKFAT